MMSLENTYREGLVKITFYYNFILWSFYDLFTGFFFKFIYSEISWWPAQSVPHLQDEQMSENL